MKKYTSTTLAITFLMRLEHKIEEYVEKRYKNMPEEWREGQVRIVMIVAADEVFNAVIKSLQLEDSKDIN